MPSPFCHLKCTDLSIEHYLLKLFLKRLAGEEEQGREDSASDAIKEEREMAGRRSDLDCPSEPLNNIKSPQFNRLFAEFCHILKSFLRPSLTCTRKEGDGLQRPV